MGWMEPTLLACGEWGESPAARYVRRAPVSIRARARLLERYGFDPRHIHHRLRYLGTLAYAGLDFQQGSLPAEGSGIAGGKGAPRADGTRLSSATRWRAPERGL